MTDNLTPAAKDKLRQTIERIERLEEEKRVIAADIKEVYGEAKAMGYDTKALRAVIRHRRQDRNERAEQEAILEVYLYALGEL
ncbi:MAG: GapR family DNA-binding domain-containing protein [Pseudomonadota bacterium]